MLGWFLASIMPFAADWSATASRWALVICASIVVGYATCLIRSVYEFDRLSRDGVRAKGVVIEVKRPLFNTVTNNAYIRSPLRLRIERPDSAAPYEAIIKGTFTFGEIPQPGAKLSVMSIRCDRNTSNSPARQRLQRPPSRERRERWLDASPRR